MERLNIDSNTTKNKIPLILIFGPTAVGKTELLLRCFSGKSEVISADSMQAYRGMDIGTATADSAVLEKIKHHLISFKNIDEQYTSGEFVRFADDICASLYSENKIPVVSGGTAFYLKNFIFGMPQSPVVPDKIRQQVQSELEQQGPEQLYQKLVKIDPGYAARISANDHYRIGRALEVIYYSGKPLSSFQQSDTPRSKYDFLIIGLWREREELYQRINLRVDQMFDEGLIDEIKALFKQGWQRSDPGMQAIGYREFFLMQEAGCLSYSDIKEQIKQNTRRYAKRQLTFFKRFPQVKWIKADQLDVIEEEIRTFYQRSGFFY